MPEQSRATRITLFDGLRGRSPLASPRPVPTIVPTAPEQPSETEEPLDGPALRAALIARRRPLIEAALETIRPNLRRDGGDCQLVKIEGDAVFVRLTSACVGCQLASVTVAGVRQRLVETVGMPLRVIPVE